MKTTDTQRKKHPETSPKPHRTNQSRSLRQKRPPAELPYLPARPSDPYADWDFDLDLDDDEGDLFFVIVFKQMFFFFFFFFCFARFL